jgi:hypothetical protein
MAWTPLLFAAQVAKLERAEKSKVAPNALRVVNLHRLERKYTQMAKDRAK